MHRPGWVVVRSSLGKERLLSIAWSTRYLAFMVRCFVLRASYRQKAWRWYRPRATLTTGRLKRTEVKARVIYD